MKNKKIIIIITLILVLNIFSIQNVFADEHKLEDLDISVFINSDGSAKIVEKRKANLIEGSENFKVVGNLGKSKIKDFIVKEDGKTYDYVDSWDVKATRVEKKYKNGIIHKEEGYELIWGIGDYGQHEYIVEYIVTDFIKELEDSQILFWRFANDKTNIPPENVKVTVESEKPINYDKDKVWAFGYKGDVSFVDNKIIAKSSKALTKENYVTILLKFPKGSFATNDYIDKPFEEIRDEAFKGSDYGKGNKSIFTKDSIVDVLKILIPILIAVIFFVFIVKIIRKGYVAPKTFRRRAKQEYHRENPLEDNFLDLYYIPYNMGAGSFETLLTSFILKWIKQGKIETLREETGIFKKKKQTNIKFLNKNVRDDTFEGELYNMLLDRVNSKDLLEEKQFAKWAKRNKRKINNWEEDVREASIDKLEEKGYIKTKEKRKFLFKVRDINLTEKGQQLEDDIYRYMNYLYDFSFLNEKEAIDVKLWDDIMITASALGLTNVVRTQFRKLYPRYDSETVYIDNTAYFASNLANTVGKASTPTSARSSGAGGFSSSGGGGGSFGGGSGGGTR